MGDIITLTTDFGTKDWFVGTIKGVILRIQPGATVLDITHEIPAGNLRAAAFALAASCRFFPRGTIHVAVVDPGVGSRRGAILVQTSDYFFLGPDNGILSWALKREKIQSVRRLENEKYFLLPVSQTFHGRDVFAPVAAHLSEGVPLKNFGPEQKEFIRLPWPEPKRLAGKLQGEIIYIDRFGNAITNLNSEWLADLDAAKVYILAAGHRLSGVKGFYQEAPAGRAVALVSSSGFLEIAVNGGSAAAKLRLRIGDKVFACAS